MPQTVAANLPPIIDAMYDRLQLIEDALAIGDHDAAARELATLDHKECRFAWAEVHLNKNHTIAPEFISACDDVLNAATRITPPSDKVLLERYQNNQRNIGLRHGYAALLLSQGEDVVQAQMLADARRIAAGAATGTP